MKTIFKSLLIGGLMLGLSGCMGQMGLSQTAMGWNMKAVDNRYGRATIYMVASPIYAIIGAVDFVIFNSVEFWTGTNPYTGKKAIVDQKIDTWMKVNDSLGKDLSTAPVTDIRMFNMDENSVGLEMNHKDGTQSLLVGKKVDDHIDFYLDNSLITTMTLEQIQMRVAAQPNKAKQLTFEQQGS